MRKKSIAAAETAARKKEPASAGVEARREAQRAACAEMASAFVSALLPTFTAVPLPGGPA